MNYIKVIIGAFIGGVIALMLFLMFAPKPEMPSGAVASGDASTITNQFVFTKGLQIGTTATNRTLINGVIATTCTGIVYASLNATTTAAFDCAVTGALTTAKFVDFGAAVSPTLGNSFSNSIVLWGGHASTTAGYVSGYITNLTNVATSSYPQATTSIPVLVIQ